MTNICYSMLFVAFILSCKVPATKELSIQGTWHLLYGVTVTAKDTTVTDYTKGQKMIKILNASHFSFLRHDLSRGKDTAIYDGGGGTYTLEGNRYVEQLEYCSARAWEGKRFEFTVSIDNDTLIQTGVEKLPELGIDRVITEKYVRVK